MSPAARDARSGSLRARLTRSLHQWHWISSALCLVGLLFFALTGMTLNHAAQLPARPQLSQQQGQLPVELQAQLRTASDEAIAALPEALQAWLQQRAIRTRGGIAEWSADEVYLSLPQPGGDAWLAIDRDSGAFEYEHTEHGWIAYFNDLHKGRHTGTAWAWFIDLFAAACLVFALSGLGLLWIHARRRGATWPTVALGLLLPLLLMLLIH